MSRQYWTEPFAERLRAIINQDSKENGSDTPDWILGDFLNGCLEVFDRAVKARTGWYGNAGDRPGAREAHGGTLNVTVKDDRVHVDRGHNHPHSHPHSNPPWATRIPVPPVAGRTAKEMAAEPFPLASLEKAVTDIENLRAVTNMLKDQVQELEQELFRVDAALGNRTALDAAPDRAGKIGLACAQAAKAQDLERDLELLKAKMVEQIAHIQGKFDDAQAALVAYENQPKPAAINAEALQRAFSAGAAAREQDLTAALEKIAALTKENKSLELDRRTTKRKRR